MAFKKIKYAALAASLGLFSVAGVGAAAADTQTTPMGTRTTGSAMSATNAARDYSSLQEAEKALGFNVMTPSNLPSGYSQKTVRLTDDRTLEVVYGGSGNNTIVYRATRGAADDMANMTTGAMTKTIDVNGRQVNANVNRNNNRIEAARWQEGQMNYSLRFSEAVDEAEFQRIASSIKAAN